MAVNMVYHGGLGEMDIKNAMVDGVSVRRLDRTGRARRVCTIEYT